MALALLLSACASGDDELQAAFDGSERSDVLEYLNWHMEDARVLLAQFGS